MSKINKVNITEVWGYNELFPILQDAFCVLYHSYLAIFAIRKNSPYKKPENAKKWFLEDAITDDLIKDEFQFDKKFDYSFVPQYKDIENQSRIDIAVRWRVAFGQYFNLEIECKQLKSLNIDYIISGGIAKFKTEKYSKYLTLGGLLLYNIENSILNNINSLNTLIERKLSSNEILTECSIILDYQYTYKSIHKRNNNSNLCLYSCVFEFNELIEN